MIKATHPPSIKGTRSPEERRSKTRADVKNVAALLKRPERSVFVTGDGLALLKERLDRLRARAQAE